jgi:hypothetical protein
VRTFTGAVFLTLAISALAMFFPLMVGQATPFAEWTVYALQTMWLLSIIWCVSAFGTKGLWLFLSAPFALWWPWSIAILCGRGPCF